MRAHSLTSCSGFTFIAAIIMVVILGIFLGAAGQSWQTIIKRDQEEELLFRGSQILDALEQWRKPPTGGAGGAGGNNPPPPQNKTGATTPPPRTGMLIRPLADLKYLLEDPNSLQKKHYLRRLYKDPFTNKDFDVIKDPTQGIIGVASASNDKPFKIDFQNMSGVYKTFEKKEHYSDWKFVPMNLQTLVPGKLTITGLPDQPPPPGGMQQ